MKLLLPLCLALCLATIARADDFLPGVKRILFLGDSITYAGGYVDDFELFLALKHPDREITVIDCGLPSETVSGLSEAGHAGGKFPRPDLHERLDRVLALAKPDLVFACYGMNCGIYLPFDEARFAKYREGITKLRTKVKAAGAEIIHLTPALFDPVPLKGNVVPAEGIKDGQMFAGYDEVLTRSGEWLVQQGKEQGWKVIDTHAAMRAALEAGRKGNPDFTFARDGVHPNDAGHHAIAGALFAYFHEEFDPTAPAHAELRKLIHQRGRILADSYLATAGHLRPGMAKGLPVEEALAKAAPLTERIRVAAK
jgi:lysophospholipase L1-like esterase